MALAITVALGLLSRSRSIGWYVYDKSLGDVAYAVAAYLTLVLLLRWGAAFVAIMALLACLAVEMFKLTGIPARFGHIWFVPIVLGTGFS